ncbi:MAG: response regulator [Bdellovibrionaceae bacterium]|nr:response regulator [Pseudobdellovibrionaceae bacterium]
MRNAVKVLIVDDDKASGQVLSEVVKRLGFKPILTNKPVDALNVVRLQTVHAALVDVLLPKMSGVELVMEFRKTKFADNPVVFVSGVFKDKAFAADALKRTGGVDFLFKPFGVEEFTISLKKALGPLLVSERWSVQSLLTRKLVQPRDRSRAIEHLEQIKGLDFPFVLAFLLDAGVSGHLNIVSDSGEIFGVTLSNGSIAEVDSTESQSTAVLALISNGYLAQEDWDDYQASGNKRFPLERLVQEGYVSPHAVGVAKREQILYDFKSICAAQILQLNFVPQDDGEEVPKHAVRMGELMTVFVFAMQEFFPHGYLTDFYTPILQSPMRFNRSIEQATALLDSPIFAPIKDLRAHIEASGTLGQYLASHPEQADLTYQAIHLLLLNGMILFDDVNRARDLNSNLERYKKLWAELQHRTPDKIFEYFGASPNASAAVLNNIFEEYVKSNNPDHLSSEANSELQTLCRNCFNLVSNAHAIMTDETKRVLLFEEMKLRSADNIKISNKLAAEGLELLRKGQFGPALQKVKEAEARHPTSLQFLIQVWAEIKAGAYNDKPRLLELSKKLDSMPADDRKSAYYFMALGLVKKSLGDSSASGYFEKALQLDSLFVEARRELNSMNMKQPKKRS